MAGPAPGTQIPDGSEEAPGRRTMGQKGNARPATRSAAIPREVLVPELPAGRRRRSRSGWRAGAAGRSGSGCPLRGPKKALLETVARNAAESLALHKTRRASDLTTRSRALAEIQEALGLDEAPLRIECYDVSNLQGTHVVASMVVFEDGLARKGEYRRFSIRGLDGTDDVAAIHEVISRRFRRYLDEREATGELDSLGDPEVSRRGRAAAQVRLPAQPGRDRRRAGPGGRRGPRAR